MAHSRATRSEECARRRRLTMRVPCASRGTYNARHRSSRNQGTTKPTPKSLRGKSGRKRMIRQRADLARQPYVQQILRSLAHPSTPSTHNTAQQLVALPVWRPTCAISRFCPVSAIHPNPHRIRTVDCALLPVPNSCVAVATHDGAGCSPPLDSCRRSRAAAEDAPYSTIDSANPLVHPKLRGGSNPGRFTIPYHG